MGVYINMETPKSCAFCRFYGAYCYAKGDEDVHSTLPCPLVPVPPHGRLGDLDKLADNMCSATAGMENRAIIMHEIRRAPTVLEAEEGE